MKPFLHEIQKAVCQHYGIKRSDLLSPARRYEVAHPRQVAFLLAKEMTAHGPTQIGRLTGGRNHSTVITGIRAARARWFERGDVYADVNAIRSAVLAKVEARA